MAKKDYIPTNDADLLIWGKKIIAYAGTHHEKWLVCAPEAIIGNSYNDYYEKYEISINANSGKLDIVKRNESRKNFVKLMRSYVQGFIAKNPLVTTDDKAEMGLAVADAVATPAGDPTGIATADISYPGAMQLMLHLKHVDGTGNNEKANYGFRIYFDVYVYGSTPPATGKDLHQSRFTRHKKELFIFEPEDSGKIAWFCIRYENSKGKAGPWGRMFSAIIP